LIRRILQSTFFGLACAVCSGATVFLLIFLYVRHFARSEPGIGHGAGGLLPGLIVMSFTLILGFAWSWLKR
jgi:hypothetical protein